MKAPLRLTIEVHPSTFGEGNDFQVTLEGVGMKRHQTRQYVPADLFVSVYDQVLERAGRELKRMASDDLS